MESPARARYSPLASRAASCAVAGAAPIASHAARKAGSRAFKVLGTGTISPSVRLAAAGKRHRQAGALGKRRVRWRGSRRQEGRNGLDVVFGQKARNDLHAVRRSGSPGAVTPAAELRADVAGAQAEQTGYRRLHASESRTVATGAGRHAALRVAIDGNRFAACENLVADGGNSGRREWRPQRGKVFRHLLQIRVGQKVQQIVHWREFSAPSPALA